MGVTWSNGRASASQSTTDGIKKLAQGTMIVFFVVSIVACLAGMGFLGYQMNSYLNGRSVDLVRIIEPEPTCVGTDRGTSCTGVSFKNVDGEVFTDRDILDLTRRVSVNDSVKLFVSGPKDDPVFQEFSELKYGTYKWGLIGVSIALVLCIVGLALVIKFPWIAGGMVGFLWVT